MTKPPERFKAVVVGSGFGGSVMACRLAEAGLSVCVLERGKPYPPGSFPRMPHDVRRNFWDPTSGRYGLFDVWSFQNMDGVVSAGLGGGSLIYANVLIRKDEKWFIRDGYRGEHYEYWPVTRDDLQPHYDAVEASLKGEVYPFDDPPYNTTAKTIAMQRAANDLGIPRTTHQAVDSEKTQWYLPLLAVSFASNGKTAPGLCLPDDRNLHGATRQTCRLCGECDIGCNYGAKNTLDFNYLSRAKLAEAEIRTLAEVTRFERCRNGPGYAVHYIQHDPKHRAGARKHEDTFGHGDPRKSADAHAADLRTIEADLLVLACGTFGTNFLMLKHREECSRLSNSLGTRFSGNGDVINVAFSCGEDRPPEPATGRKGRRRPILIEGSRGPVITSTFRFPDSVDNGAEPGAGFYLQEAGYPLLVDWLLELADLPAVARRAGRFVRELMKRRLGLTGNSEAGGDLARLLGRGSLSSTSLTLLGMGREEADGLLHLVRRKGRPRLELDRNNAATLPYYRRAVRESRKVGQALGGAFVPDPLVEFFNRRITVHPVGGCPMGRDSSEGVVDSYGEVFGHENLFIVDGSIMPGPVGPNPSLTIAALADRSADYILGRPTPRTVGTCGAP